MGHRIRKRIRKENTLTGIRFERSHGSVWGYQFSVEVRPEEVLWARYFLHRTRELSVWEHIPITAGEWDGLSVLAESLALRRERPAFLQKLRMRHSADSPLKRRLILIRKTPWGERELAFRWPFDPKANELETLLEKLVQKNTQTKAVTE